MLARPSCYCICQLLRRAQSRLTSAIFVCVILAGCSVCRTKLRESWRCGRLPAMANMPWAFARDCATRARPSVVWIPTSSFRCCSMTRCHDQGALLAVCIASMRMHMPLCPCAMTTWQAFHEAYCREVKHRWCHVLVRSDAARVCVVYRVS